MFSPSLFLNLNIPWAHMVAVEGCLKREAVGCLLRAQVLRLLLLLKLKESTENLYTTINYKMELKSYLSIIILLHNCSG